MSKKLRHIRNPDTLEKDIYRLKLEAKQIEDKLDGNLDYLQHNYASLVINSVFHHSPAKEKVKEKIFNSFWENERITKGVDKIIGHLADKASEGIENLIDKILHKKN